MNAKPRLDIVLGATYNFSDIEGLRALEAQFEVTFHAFETPIIHHLTGAAQLKIYAVIEDMPSYMRGIEPELAGADAILALGNQNISSFQACRAADNLQIPFFLIVDEMREVTKEQYGHIYILQSEVLRSAKKVYPISAAIRHNLLAAGCKKTKLSTIPPFVSSTRYQFDATRRQKFRDYLQLAPEKVLILFNQPLRAGFRPRLAMDWLRFMRSENPKLFSQLSMLFCKGGELSHGLKTEALNYDLTHHVKFLDQDTSGFVRDLYSAGDIVLANSIPCEDHLVEIFPRWQIEMIAAGMVPIYPADTPVKKLIKKTLNFSHDHDLGDIYKGVKGYLAKRKVDCRSTIAGHQWQSLHLSLGQDRAFNMMAEDINEAIAASGKTLHTPSSGAIDTASPSGELSDKGLNSAPASNNDKSTAPSTGSNNALGSGSNKGLDRDLGKGILTLVSEEGDPAVSTPLNRCNEECQEALAAGDLVTALTLTEKLIELSRSVPNQQANFYYQKATIQRKLQERCADPFAGEELSKNKSQQAAPIEQALEICLGLDPSHNNARLELARSFFDRDRAAEAATVLLETPADQASNDHLYLLAQCLQDDGQIEEAISTYLDLMRKDHKSQVIASRICRMLADYPISVDEKITMLKETFAIDPAIRIVRQSLIAAFLTAGTIEEGKAWLDEQVAKAENDQLLEEIDETNTPTEDTKKAS